MNVLLIEPDSILADTYKKALENAGHKVGVANSAQEAVHEADKSKPDVVVLELQLPGHGGVEFLYEFRSYLEWQKLPVILHTMVATQSFDASQSDELGVVEHLYKPSTDLRRLVASVNAAA